MAKTKYQAIVINWDYTNPDKSCDIH